MHAIAELLYRAQTAGGGPGAEGGGPGGAPGGGASGGSADGDVIDAEYTEEQGGGRPN
jgi:hypothetical protein